MTKEGNESETDQQHDRDRKGKISSFFPDDLVHLKSDPAKLGFVKRTFLDLSDEDDSEDDDDDDDEEEEEEEMEKEDNDDKEPKVIPRANPTRDHSLDENPAVRIVPRHHFERCHSRCRRPWTTTSWLLSG